jgi:CRP/FNR family transcriptional regulator
MTQRYLRRGDVSGIPAFFIGRASAECQAILDSVYYQVQGEAWRERARRDAQLSYVLLQEVSRILDVTFVHLAEEALGSMRQRVARQLLDIAADRQVSHDLVAPVTQQQLADDIGSVREVVARALRDLRERGIVATGTRGIVILDAQALRAELDPVA